MKLALIPVISLFFLFINSCSSSKKISASNNEKPPIHLPDSLPQLPPSDINLRVELFAPPMLAKADSMVPKEFNSDNWPDFSQPACDFRYKYHFVRSPLSLTCVNNKIGIQFTGNYQLSGSKCLCALNKPVTPWISGSCGYGNEPLRKIGITVSSQLYFLPTYKLKTVTKLERLEAYDKCIVSMFSSDVTGLVADSVRSSVNAFCNKLDSAINSIDFSKTLLPLYLHYKTVPVSRYGFISLNPISVQLGQLNFSKDTFSISIGASCRPKLSSDSASSYTSIGFPMLSTDNNKTESSIYLNADYDYVFLSKLLDDTLRDKSFEIKGRTIVVRNASVKGAGNHQIEVMVDFSGSNSGRLYLRGTPVLDVANQTLAIPDISYSIEDEDLALKIAKKLFHNKIKKSLSGKSYLDIGALIKSKLPVMEAKLNNYIANNIYSEGKINELKIAGLLVKNDGIQVQVYANAHIKLAAAALP
ncbi:MAG: DUF4403 family protein [Bacteroidetes bacterium]|nr:DUF4403 family protein [Bacteroidota bacterium]MBS1973765.1 DUF4403 family protein [Bacteroidota bacterium]